MQQIWSWLWALRGKKAASFEHAAAEHTAPSDYWFFGSNIAAENVRYTDKLTNRLHSSNSRLHWLHEK